LLAARTNNSDLVFTTGGTGIGPRDLTPDVVLPLLDKTVPGIMESIRFKYGQNLPSALLSRSVAGVMGTCLVYTLPGSVRAVSEYLAEILKTLPHSLLMLWGIDAHH
ncbi:MAG TPA: molybdopterin-binding protein, partial [bacterium]|nr:molybdopterin-binding protein [bacterium]